MRFESPSELRVCLFPLRLRVNADTFTERSRCDSQPGDAHWLRSTHWRVRTSAAPPQPWMGPQRRASESESPVGMHRAARGRHSRVRGVRAQPPRGAAAPAPAQPQLWVGEKSPLQRPLQESGAELSHRFSGPAAPPPQPCGSYMPGALCGGNCQGSHFPDGETEA